MRVCFTFAFVTLSTVSVAAEERADPIVVDLAPRAEAPGERMATVLAGFGVGASQDFEGFRFLLDTNLWVSPHLGVGARVATGADATTLESRGVVQGAPMLYARMGLHTSHAVLGAGFGARATTTRQAALLSETTTQREEVVPSAMGTLGWLWHDRAATFGPSLNLDVADFEETMVLLAFSVGGSWIRASE